MYPGDKRTLSDTAFSARKESKKRKGMDPTEAESALDSEELKAMLVCYGGLRLGDHGSHN